MQYAPLGRTGARVSRVGLGTWAMGGGNDWGPAEDGDSLNAVCAALDEGVNLFDTAPVYGDGRAEELLGRALKGRRTEAFIATKCGLVRFAKGINHWLKPESIRRELEDSLRRLQTDYIDLYQIHWPDPATPLEDALAELTRQKEAGKIRFIGVCNFTPELLSASGAAECVQGPCSLLDHARADELLPLCREKELGFLAYGPLAGGVLTGKYKKEPNIRRSDARSYFYRFYKGENFSRTDGVARRVLQAAARYGAPPAAIAAGWVLARPEVTAALCGARNARQVGESVRACAWRPAPDELAFLEDGYAGD